MQRRNARDDGVESVFASMKHTAVELVKVVGISFAVTAVMLGLAGGAFYVASLVLQREGAGMIAMFTVVLEIGAGALFMKRRYDVHQRADRR